MEWWEEKTIGELLDAGGGHIKTGPFGTALKASEYSSTGPPLISVGEIGYGRFNIHSSTPRVPPEVIERLPEYLLEEGDIVFGRKGAVDRSAMVRAENAGWFLGSDGIRLRPPPSCDSKFLSYHFQSPQTRSWLHQHSTGSTMASLNQGTIARVPILLPPLAEQRAIAGVLGALDDKIEANRRMNATLEAMARALFKSWFVDFDPVYANMGRAKMEGREPAIAPDLAALFPARLTDSPLGPIPEGWEVKALSEIVDVSIGRTPPRREQHHFTTDDGDWKWLSIKDMGREGMHILETDERLTLDSVERFGVPIIPAGSVAVSFKLTVGRVAFIPEPMCSNEAIAHLKFRLGAPPFAAFLYFWMKEFDYSQLGSTSSIATAVNSQSIRGVPVLFDAAAVSKFAELAAPLMERILTASKQSRTLAQLRDLLLPKLLSGALRVRDAEAMVEDAA